MDHKSHDSCSHKKYMEAGVMTFVAHCTFYTLAQKLASWMLVK